MTPVATPQSEVILTPVNISPCPLSLIDFISEVIDIPPRQMTLELFESLVARVAQNDNFNQLVQQHTIFKADRLGMKTILGNEFLSISAVSLLPGQKSDIHRHAHSCEVSPIIQGTVTVRLFKINERQELVLDSETDVEAGEIACCDYYEYHQIINNSQSKVVCVPFHNPALPKQH